MSKRRINPATGRVELTYREEKLVDEYIKNGGNGKQAAIAAGYGSARADQSAYQVLRRAQIQQHIRDRISESRVSTEEIIGTLVSCMRGNLAQCLNEDGDFDFKVVNQKRLGHLLKTISGTTRRIQAKDGQPPEIVRNYRVQLHSPLQAASILDSANINVRSDTGSRSGGGPLATRDSGPSRSYDSDPDLQIIQERIDQCTSIPTQGSRLQTRDSVQTQDSRPQTPDSPPNLQPSTCNLQPKSQHWQPFRRVTGKLANLRKINSTQYLNPARRAPGAHNPTSAFQPKRLRPPPEDENAQEVPWY